MRRNKLVLSLVGIVLIAYGAMAAVLISGTTPALGLDLQGGISVTQRPKDGTSYNDESLDLAVEKIRERVDSLGVAEPEILRQGDTIVVNLPGVKNQRQAEQLVQVTGQVYLRPVLQCQAIDPPDPNATTTTTSPDGSTTTGPSTTVGVTTTTAAPGPSRPATGDTTPDDSTPGDTSTTTPGATSTTTPGETTTTVETPLDEHGLPLQQSDPTTQQYLPLKGDDPVYCLVGPAQGTGEVFSDNASAGVLGAEGWGVTVDLRGGADGEGVFNAAASACNQQAESCPTGQLAIELDGTIQSAPSMNEPSYSGGIQITGDFTDDEARNLARVLNSGSLPVQLQLESVQNVSPTLGKDSLRAAWISGLIGVGLVLLFMVLYYRTLGIIVAIGMTVSSAILWSVISLLSKTQGLALSLSGIAGIIVSVGVTVDSYVVFFERLKDEVRSGKTLRNSAQRGFTAAWHTIVLADIVSLIGALVLWYLTVGAVRGFAFFLALSTACDLVVSYFFTRPAVLLAARTKWMERRKVMGLEVTAATGGAS